MTAVSRAFTVFRGLVYSAAFIGLWAWLAIGVRSFDGDLGIRLPAGLRPIGLALAGAGAALAVACIATFLTTGRGTPAPFDPPRAFVVSGPYRYVRNPMYVGAAVALVGAGLAASSAAILLLAAGFLLLMHLFVVLHEEPTLAATFGPSYERYRATVNRWLVRLPRGKSEP